MQKPMAQDTATFRRWRHQRLRRRILDGHWEDDARDRAKQLVGAMRTHAWGYLDRTSNPLRMLADQFATLYDHEPSADHRDATEEQVQVLADALEECGYWAFMQRVQRDTVALRETFVRHDIDSRGNLVYEQIDPDLVRDVEYDLGGRRILTFNYLRLRRDPAKGDYAWFWDVFEVVDGIGRLRVVRDKDARPMGEDMSAAFLRTADGGASPVDGLIGDEYPYIDNDGVAYVPVVRYRAQLLGGRQWDWGTWSEVVEGTLNTSVYWSFWGHVVKDASWPQRYTVGAEVRGAHVENMGGTKTRGIVLDPGTLLLMDPQEEFVGQPLVGQFAAGGDPEVLSQSISVYEARIAAGVGINPSDVTRTSGDPRSGYALAVSNEGKRKLQAALKPAFRQADRISLEVMCALMNSTGLYTVLPERGWKPKYVALPLSAEERDARRRDAFERFDRGLIDEVDVLRALSADPMSRSEAARELERVRDSIVQPEVNDDAA